MYPSHLAKNVLILLGLTTETTAIDAAVNKKTFGLGMATLKISSEQMNDIIKIGKSLEESGLLRKYVSKANENEDKKAKKEDFSGTYSTL